MSEKQMRPKARHGYDGEETQEAEVKGNHNKKSNKSKKKKTKKRHIFLKIVIILLILAVIAFGAVVAYGFNMLNQMNRTEIDKNEIQINEGVSTTRIL